MYRRLISIAMELFPLPGLTAEFASGSPSLVKENLKVNIHGRAPSPPSFSSPLHTLPSGHALSHPLLPQLPRVSPAPESTYQQLVRLLQCVSLFLAWCICISFCCSPTTPTPLPPASPTTLLIMFCHLLFSSSHASPPPLTTVPPSPSSAPSQAPLLHAAHPPSIPSLPLPFLHLQPPLPTLPPLPHATPVLTSSHHLRIFLFIYTSSAPPRSPSSHHPLHHASPPSVVSLLHGGSMHEDKPALSI